MALSAHTQPHFTTIADFIASMGEEAIQLFRDVLLICDAMKLIGSEMFAVDGCKLPSNASKEWSGTKADLARKKDKMEGAIRRILEKHREADHGQTDREVQAREEQYVATLRRRVKKLKQFLEINEDKPGKSGAPLKSNITDNESAKMKTSHGVIQGYDGVAMVDHKHQVIVHAEAFGEAQEQELMVPMIEGTCENLKAIGKPDAFERAKLTADSGFHSEKNVRMLMERGIDAYVADHQFRQRDPRFKDVDRYKERHRREQAAFVNKVRLVPPEGFHTQCRPTLLHLPGWQAAVSEWRQCDHPGLPGDQVSGSKDRLPDLRLASRVPTSSMEPSTNTTGIPL